MIKKEIWDIKINDRVIVDNIEHLVTETHLVKPNLYFIGKAVDDNMFYKIKGNVHNDTLFDVLETKS